MQWSKYEAPGHNTRGGVGVRGKVLGPLERRLRLFRPTWLYLNDWFLFLSIRFRMTSNQICPFIFRKTPTSSACMCFCHCSSKHQRLSALNCIGLLQGFYAVYRDVFRKVSEEDKKFCDDADSDDDVDLPGFGDVDSDYDAVSLARPAVRFFHGFQFWNLSKQCTFAADCCVHLKKEQFFTFPFASRCCSVWVEEHHSSLQTKVDASCASSCTWHFCGYFC